MSSDDPKPDNFGGIPDAILSSVMILFSPTLTKGITKDTAINVLATLVTEEHEALNPGGGTAGFFDVAAALNDLKAGVKAVNDASSSTIDAKAAELVDKIGALSTLWQIGPVAAGFFTVDKS
jgi:hypothetical protein